MKCRCVCEILRQAGLISTCLSTTTNLPPLLPHNANARRLRDNPTPLEFPISFIGAKPAVQVTLNDPPPPPPPAIAAGPSAARLSTDGGRHGGATWGRGGRPGPKDALIAAADHLIQFERLLVGKTATKSFTVANLGVLPLKWRVAGADGLPAEFKVNIGVAAGAIECFCSHGQPMQKHTTQSNCTRSSRTPASWRHAAARS